MGGTTRTSAVGACEVRSSVATTPSVQYSMSHYVSLSNRPVQVISRSLESIDSASLGSQHSQSLSSGLDQLRVTEGGSLGVSVSSLSPTSLMFPIPNSGFSSLPGPSSSVLAVSSVSASASLSFLCCTSSLVHSFFLILGFFSFVYVCLFCFASFGSFCVRFLSLFFLSFSCFVFLSACFLFLFPSLPSSSSSSSSWVPSCVFVFLSSSFFPSSSSSSSSFFFSFSSSCRSSFVFFSSWIFSSLLFFLLFLGFRFLGVGGISCECLGVISGLSIASPFVCEFWGDGFCRVGALVFSSLIA